MPKTRKASATITPEDIADFRVVLQAQQQAQLAGKRLAKKFSLDFVDLAEWARRLGSRKIVSDSDVCFALGRLSYDDDVYDDSCDD